jgi:hypothetical protein
MVSTSIILRHVSDHDVAHDCAAKELDCVVSVAWFNIERRAQII